jgi:cell division protein FtsA
VYCAGTLYGLTTIPLGGYHLTSDIAGLLDISYSDAERAKRVYGAGNILDSPEIDLGARTISGWQRQAQQGDAPREAVQTIAGARLIQLFSEVTEWLNSQNLRGSLLAGAVLTGGGARLAGAEEIGKRVIGVEVRSGGVVAGEGFPAIADTAVTSAVGLLRYCVSRSTRAAARRPPSRFDALGSTKSTAQQPSGGEERVSNGGLVNNGGHPDARGWGRSVTRWMREFIPARGS